MQLECLLVVVLVLLMLLLLLLLLVLLDEKVVMVLLLQVAVRGAELVKVLAGNVLVVEENLNGGGRLAKTQVSNRPVRIRRAGRADARVVLGDGARQKRRVGQHGE